MLLLSFGHTRRLVVPLSAPLLVGSPCKRWATTFLSGPVQDRINESNASRSRCPVGGDLERQFSKWTLAEDDLLVRLRQEGRQLKEVAVHLHRTYNQVSHRTQKVLRQRGLGGLLMEISPKRWREEEDATLLKLRQEGMSFRVISERLARTPGSVQFRHTRLTQTANGASETWTEAETEKLATLLRSKQLWPTTFAAFPSRSRLAVQTRCDYIRPYLNSGQEYVRERRRYPWTPALTQELVHLKEDVQLSWLEIQQRMQRWTMQCLMDRYYTIRLQSSTRTEKPPVRAKAWTADEDSRILQARATSKWLDNARKTLPHRTRDAIKNRWRKHLQYSHDLKDSEEDNETCA